MALTDHERRKLLATVEHRDLLRFELAAHDQLLHSLPGQQRRDAYAEIYERWPQYVKAANGVGPWGLDQTSATLGFNEIFLEWSRAWLEKRRVLEIGCGAGAGTNALRAITGDVVGVDVSETLIALARKQYSGATFVRADVTERLPFSNGEFDAVYWNDVVEHLHPDDLDQAFREIHRVLRPDGALCTITCHIDDGPHDASMLILPQGSAPLGLHLQEFTYRGFAALLARNGFRPQIPLLGINALGRMRALSQLGRLMGSQSLVLRVERTRPSIRLKVVRWLFGTNVIFAVGLRH